MRWSVGKAWRIGPCKNRQMWHAPIASMKAFFILVQSLMQPPVRITSGLGLLVNGALLQWGPKIAAQCGNFTIFLSLIFYVKSILGVVEQNDYVHCSNMRRKRNLESKVKKEDNDYIIHDIWSLPILYYPIMNKKSPILLT